METQNITLSLPKDILLKIKLIAVQRGISVSGLLTQTLERLAEQEDAYAHARRRHLEWLDHGAALGTGGQALVGRDELHERAQTRAVPDRSTARLKCGAHSERRRA